MGARKAWLEQQVPAKRKSGGYAWFAAVNAQRCRLLRFERTADRVARVEEKGVLENSWPKHGRGRPAEPVGMTGYSHSVPPSYIAEQLRRFMNDVLTWLKRQCDTREIDSLVIMAAPRALRELRKSEDLLADRFDLRQGDLMHFSTSALAVHPKVRGLLECGATDDEQCPSTDGNEGS